MAAGEKDEVRRGLSAKGSVPSSEAAQLRQTSAKQLCWHATARAGFCSEFCDSDGRRARAE